MTPATADTLAPVGHCPHCGYDQRGLPAGGRCPECGRRFWLGLVVGDINRWADGELLNLWSIGVLQLMGMTCLFLGAAAIRQTAAAGMIMIVAAVVYLTASTIWFGITLASVLFRKARPVFVNITDRRRAQLTTWLWCDAMLVVAACLLTLNTLRQGHPG